MLEVSELSFSYNSNSVKLINELSFNLAKGQILNILGQNAVGKTTFIKCLSKEIQDYSGTIKIDNQNISDFSIKEFSKKVGVVSTTFQVYQNLKVADYLLTGYINQISPFSTPNNRLITQAHEALEVFGKQELFNKSIDQLSSGERQIVMICRAIIQNPEIIIVDEPTANLDVKNQLAVLEQIQLLSEKGYTIIVTTHNPGHSLTLGGVTLLMGKGTYMFGETNEIVNSDNLSLFYDLKATVNKTDSNEKYIVFRNEKNDKTKIIL